MGVVWASGAYLGSHCSRDKKNRDDPGLQY
jgi:hypothetical protein